jgi:hypothetical protein
MLLAVLRWNIVSVWLMIFSSKPFSGVDSLIHVTQRQYLDRGIGETPPTFGILSSSKGSPQTQMFAAPCTLV